MLGALAAWLVFSGVDIVGEGTCPAPAEVSRRLAQVAPAADRTAPTGRRVRLTRSDDAVHVELFAGGERLATRDLDAHENCDDLAAAVAIVVAAWEAELNPRVDVRVSLPPSVPAAPITTVVTAPPPTPRSTPSFDVGLALIGSSTGGQIAPGARIGGWLAPAGRRLGLGVAVSGATARSASVGAIAGAARWTRIAFGAGPEARFDVRQTMLDVHAQILTGLLRVEGVGLPRAASDTSAQLGTGVGVQVGRPWGNATPWIGADILYWAGHDRLQIAGLTAEGELPHLEIQVALGLSLGRFP